METKQLNNLQQLLQTEILSSLKKALFALFTTNNLTI